MKKALILVAFACAPVFAISPTGELDQREKALLPNCEGLGGCAVISRAQFEQIVAALRVQIEEEMQGLIKDAKDAALNAAKVCKNSI